MSTFVFKNNTVNFTPVSNVFIDKYMPKARGKFVKVYILGLKYCMSGEPGVSAAIMASKLHMLETDVLNAWNYWNDEGVLHLIPVDNMGNYSIDFIDLSESDEAKDNSVNLLEELDKGTTKGMLEDIEKLLSRPLSPTEMAMYIGWINELNFTPELILLLIEYCASRGKTDPRYIEKTALSWHDNNIQKVEDAQAYIKKHEDKWSKINKILAYLGSKDGEVMKPQEQLLTKWLDTYGFSVEVICKACDICFERINKPDFKYIDGILTNWNKVGIKTLEDIANKDTKRAVPKKGGTFNRKQNDTFSNYTQRQYDFDELEKKLLGWDDND
jgi:DnaD/phage-associated family protein